ncbi:hypothetical protein BD309DRAFT_958993 [Dichomitus squalens]|uniref:Uncharacterized protein n=1 Tax=Dichomitus squalens TaxID=114155 RepID=A0A4Q9NTU4_9APHY|nr:hypothetical protein BD309DRAFT_958993 [Dichomitus squalens]TBU54233.1 hypothetical protein BD310DRAFT_936309 [Dichomitus squalens]
METLPLELHALIVEYACTDDGATARSLALVSRYVHDVATPFLFQSLAVSGLHQMTELVVRLEALPPRARRIRHLFLSDWTHKDVIKMQKQCAPTSFLEMERYDAERAFAGRILQHAAPTLETLALVVACPYTAPPLVGQLFALPLPRLQGLAIDGFYPFPHTRSVLPRLERLHLSGNRNPYGLLQLGALEAACPQLSYLRISGLDAAPAFARELHSALFPQPLSGGIELSSSFSFPSALPVRLRELRVEVCRPRECPVRQSHPTGRQRAHSQRAPHKSGHEKMMETLREVVRRRAETRLGNVEVVEGDREDTFGEMRREWLRGD